jgi:hypothetical protein
LFGFSRDSPPEQVDQKSDIELEVLNRVAMKVLALATGPPPLPQKSSR